MKSLYKAAANACLCNEDRRDRPDRILLEQHTAREGTCRRGGCALETRAGKDLFIFGSAKTDRLAREAGLIDEYRIGLNPLVLGGGMPMLFKPSEVRMRLKLLEARPMQSGVVLLRFARV